MEQTLNKIMDIAFQVTEFENEVIKKSQPIPENSKIMEVKSKKFRDYKGNLGHIVSEFEDNGEKIVTYKFYYRHKNRWYYHSDYLELFLIGFKHGWEWVK